MNIKLLIADDHDIVRAGIKSLLQRQEDIEIIGEAADGREVVQLAERLNPSMIVMDITMPHLNGIDAASQIIRRDPDGDLGARQNYLTSTRSGLRSRASQSKNSRNV